LFNGIQEEILVIDHDFVIQDVNEIFLKRHDLTKTQVLGKKCHNIICHSDTLCEFDTQECLLEETKRTGKRAEVTYSTHQEDGKSRVLTRTIYPIRADGKVPKYFVEVSRDVTDYQNLARKFRASEKKFRAILNTATDAILSIDDDHRVVLFNDAAQRIFGYSRDEVLGKNLNMLIPPQQGDHYALVRTFLETKDPTVIGKALSIKALNREGEEFPIALGLSYHEMEGHITFTAIIRDVSEQKKLEKKLLQ
jgi:two-component system sensor kinase FixL